MRSLLKLAQPRKSLEIGLLHRVFDVCFIRKHGANDTVESLVVAPHEDLEQLDLSAADPVHDLDVRHLCDA